MHTAVLIVGQGLCGTWLSYWLHKAGIDFIVVDEGRPNSSTRIASGVINPVTGRRMSKTWMAETVITFAEEAYLAMDGLMLTEGAITDTPTRMPLIRRCDIVDFFNSPDRRVDFEKKARDYASAYLHWPADEKEYADRFAYDLGFGIISPAYQVDLQQMLEGWRHLLKKQNRLREEIFNGEQLEVKPDGVRYHDITATRIVMADGKAAASSGYFRNLPFALNKGEALILDIEGLDAQHIYKKGNTITPWREGLFWAGSTYNNHYTHEDPEPAFREQMEAWLRGVLKLPFRVLDHLAAVRPATVERRPFAGWHPLHPAVGILNGTGTKGVTLAPYFAKQLADSIANGTPIMPQADVARFARVLSR